MSHSRCLVFDLDDTLFLTSAAVWESYQLAGVPLEVAKANWGRPWVTWCGIAEHSRKIDIYKQFIADSSRTPTTSAFAIARSTTNADVLVLTSASHYAARGLLDREQFNAKLLAWSVTAAEKSTCLAGVCKRYEDLVYIDNDQSAIFWIPDAVRFIHYDGQDEAQLLKEIGWT